MLRCTFTKLSHHSSSYNDGVLKLIFQDFFREWSRPRAITFFLNSASGLNLGLPTFSKCKKYSAFNMFLPNFKFLFSYISGSVIVSVHAIIWCHRRPRTVWQFAHFSTSLLEQRRMPLTKEHPQPLSSRTKCGLLRRQSAPSFRCGTLDPTVRTVRHIRPQHSTSFSADRWWTAH